MLNVEGKPVVVQAVQTLIHEPFTLENWPDADRRSRLVFITRDIERADIEKTLAALDSTAHAMPPDPRSIPRRTRALSQWRRIFDKRSSP